MSYSYVGSGYGTECCDNKVDPISLLVTIAAIAAVSWFLRQAVIDNMIMMAKRRRREIDANSLLTGTTTLIDTSFQNFI